MRSSSPTAFTLIEMLIVLSLSALIAGVSLTDGMDAYERGLARTDQLLLLGALREARAESMNDVCMDAQCRAPSAHGIFISNNYLTIFEGSDYATRFQPADQIIPFSERETITSNIPFIVFEPDTADVASTTSFSLSAVGRETETITINTEGQISSSFAL